MAVTLQDLISAQQKLSAKENIKQERMTVAELRKIIADSSNEAKKQTRSLNKIENNTTTDKAIQLAQTVLQYKTDQDLNEDQGIANDHLNNLEKTMKEGLVDPNGKGLNSNVLKLKKTLEKQSESLQKIADEKSKDVLDKAMGMKVSKGPKSFKEFMLGTEKENKEFKTLAGFLKQSGLMSEGGRLEAFMKRKSEVKQYQEDRLKRDPQMRNLKQYQGKAGEKKLKSDLAKSYERDQGTLASIQENEAEIKRLQDAGFDIDDKRNAKLFKPLTEKRDELTSKLQKDDVRFREDKKQTAVKEVREEKKKTAKVKNESKIKQGETIVTAAREKKKQEAEGATDKQLTQESNLENDRARDKMVELLTEIDKSTQYLRPSNQQGTAKPETKENESGGILDSIMSFLGEGFMTAMRVIFNPKNILKAFTKFFLPAMIVGSLVNGIIDSFKTFMNGGSFTDVIIAGLGGVLEFLSFGLFDAKSLKKVIDTVSGFVTEYLIDPVVNFFKSVKDGFLNVLASIGIPEIKLFKNPITGNDVTIGPFYPFKGANSASAEKPSVTNGSAIYNKSSDNANATVANSTQKPQGPVVVNAPTTVANNKQNIAMNTPVRNDDGGFNRYLRKNSAII